MLRRGIDVSSIQGRPAWKKVKNAGIDFAILRCRQKYGVDASFSYNYKNAMMNGIVVGVYKYAYALTPEEAEKEAEAVIATLDGKNIEMPVFYDIEDPDLIALGPERVEEIAVAFLYRLSCAGYAVGVYCNKDTYENLLKDRLKDACDFWIASVPADDNGSIVSHLEPTGAAIWQYSFKGRIPGIDGDVDMNYAIKDYQEPQLPTLQNEGGEKMGVTATTILTILRSWLGSKSHEEIVKIYNNHEPLARGYALSMDDAWCDATVSAAFIKAGDPGIIGGTECGVEQHVYKLMKEGIWIENGATTPKVGDIIVFNWDQGAQPNDGFSDHIGVVESVSGNTIATIEGNMSGGLVGRRYIPVGWGYIRGFARPKYALEDGTGRQKTVEEVANEVLAGMWGDGTQRVNALAAAGHNPLLVQAKVNELLRGEYTPVVIIEDDNDGLSKTPKWVGKVTANRLNVRAWAGTEYPNITSYPLLSKGNLVDVCDTINTEEAGTWYYVRIAGRFFGFVSATYIERV